MAEEKKFQELEEALDFVSRLDDYPASVDGFSTEDFKSTFDKAGIILKNHMNSLIRTLNSLLIGTANFLPGGTMTGPINMNGQRLTGLNAPTENSEAATRGYVDTNKVDKSNVVNNFDTTEEGFVADARALKFLNDNKSSTELLYLNGNPLSSQPEQTIPFDAKGFSHLLIQSVSYDARIDSTLVLKVGDYGLISAGGGAAGLFSGEPMSKVRAVMATEAGLSITHCYYYSGGNWLEVSNNCVIYRVYGIKGVSE